MNTGVFSFLSHYLERKYMFLICNGILAILAKSSVSSSETPASDDQSNLGDERQLSSAPTLSSAKAEATVDDQEVQVASVESLEDIVLATDEEEEEEETTSSQALITEEEEYIEEKRECLVKQEEEGNEELASTEELNRRIEEFIRKMKEEIRIEAQQQLIAE
jgi:flagellum-specific peptidoglycan hydrolase FlgJ